MQKPLASQLCYEIQSTVDRVVERSVQAEFRILMIVNVCTDRWMWMKHISFSSLHNQIDSRWRVLQAMDLMILSSTCSSSVVIDPIFGPINENERDAQLCSPIVVRPWGAQNIWVHAKFYAKRVHNLHCTHSTITENWADAYLSAPLARPIIIKL